VGEEDWRLDVPADLYDETLLIENGESKFDRIAGREARPVVESLYIQRRGAKGVSQCGHRLRDENPAAPGWPRSTVKRNPL
jgi:hypothetical protein